MVLLYLEDVLGIKKLTHLLEPMYEVSSEDAQTALSAFERMASGEPIQYIIGKAHFYGREFNVSPSVLIPRPETEVLCRDVVEHCSRNSGLKILDMCTGSGCIAWTLALEMPGSDVTAIS